MLPSRDRKAEDEFVSGLAGSGQQKIVEAVTLAIEERRPSLAARLTRLLGEAEQLPNSSALSRAFKAMDFLIVHPGSEDHWCELDSSWAAWRQSRRVARAKQRMRPIKDPRGRRPWPRR